MAIKVRHDGSAAPTIAGSFAGGRGKRAAEDARAFAQIRAQEDQKAAELAQQRQLEAMRLASSMARPGQAHAQLIHAPLSPVHASAPTPGGVSRTVAAPRAAAAAAKEPRTFHYSSRQNPEGLTRVSAGSGGAASGDYKVTGTSMFDRPDDESQWDPGNGGRWIRPWLPGEKEAEAQRRVGEVQNDLALTTQGRREREALVNDVIAGVKEGRFSPEELSKLIEQFGIAEDTIRMADALREHQPTPEEDFKRNTYTDKNGVVFDRTGKVLYNPNEAAMRREDALKARADKYELELRKPVVTYDSDGVKHSTMRTDEEIQQLMQRRFPELYPSAPPPAEPPAAETVSPDKDEFAQFRRK